MIYHQAKRVVDFLVALALLIMLSPVIALVTLLLAVANSGQPFFVQKRPGLRGRLFSILKFKTMNDKRDVDGKLMPDDVRLTTIGRWVRKLSLDELPQLLNVLRGDMSLIGPRPLLPEYLPLYDQEQSRRHDVRPGITGWAQVNGRNAIGWAKRFQYDVWYVDNASPWVDALIVVKTLQKVIMRDGISAEGSATMTRFKGEI